MDACPGGQAVQEWKRGKKRLQRAVHLSLRVVDGEVVRTLRVTGKYIENSETVGWGQISRNISNGA